MAEQSCEGICFQPNYIKLSGNIGLIKIVRKYSVANGALRNFHPS